MHASTGQNQTVLNVSLDLLIFSAIVVEGSAESCSPREDHEDRTREETSELGSPGAIRPPQSEERGRPEELLQHETTFPLPDHTGHGEFAGSGIIIGMQTRP